MAWLTPLKSAPIQDNWRPIYPFEQNKSYWLLDLDGRDGVEGVAQHYLYGQAEGYFARRLVNELENAREQNLGSIAIYTKFDGHADIAYVFASEETPFVDANILEQSAA